MRIEHLLGSLITHGIMDKLRRQRPDALWALLLLGSYTIPAIPESLKVFLWPELRIASFWHAFGFGT
jgi:hypothetical protein